LTSFLDNTHPSINPAMDEMPNGSRATICARQRLICRPMWQSLSIPGPWDGAPARPVTGGSSNQWQGPLKFIFMQPLSGSKQLSSQTLRCKELRVVEFRKHLGSSLTLQDGSS
jgi:hypothetical protein